MKMKLYSIHAFSVLINRTPQTLRNWEKCGVFIPHHKGPNGYRHKQKVDLERQIENVRMYLTTQGKRANNARKMIKELSSDD
jgi:DNA-binding transcriptional MerR regulator